MYKLNYIGFWCNDSTALSKSVRSGFESLVACQKLIYGVGSEVAKHADCNSVLHCIGVYLKELATLKDICQSSLGAHVTCEAALVRIQPSPPRLTLEDKSAGEVNVVRQSCLLLMVNLLIIYGYLALWNAALRAPREDSSTLSISTRAVKVITVCRIKIRNILLVYTVKYLMGKKT